MKSGVKDDVRRYMEKNYIDLETFGKIGILSDMFSEVFKEMDKDMCRGVNRSKNKRGRGRNQRCSYCYILCREIEDDCKFSGFCLKTFYGGKGQNGRSYTHLKMQGISSNCNLKTVVKTSLISLYSNGAKGKVSTCCGALTVRHSLGPSTVKPV